MQLTDKQKGIALSLIGVLVITPDSLLIRLINIPSWELLFYRGLVPFVFLLIFFIVYKLLIAFTPLTGGTIGAPHVIIFLFYLSYGMKFLANKIKRLHDNNKSGWFLIWTLIPILGQLFGLYILVTNWFMRGTIGSNDFGDDPVKKDITPVITIKDAGKTFGLLLIVSALIAGYVFFANLITGRI